MKLGYFLNIGQIISCSLLIGTILPFDAAFGVVVTRQEFSGELNLITASPMLEDSVPENSGYSGFILYDETNSLVDWEIEVDEPNLSLNPDSRELGLTPTIDFDLSSADNWNLVVDFGIAFDAPRYTITKNPDAEIAVTSELGLAGGYSYTDPSSAIAVTSVDDSLPDSTSIPESNNVLGLIAACGVGLSFLKRQRFAK